MNRLPDFTTTEILSHVDHPELTPRYRWRQRSMAKLALLSMLAGAHAYGQDVKHNMEREASGTISVQEIAPALDPRFDDYAIVALNGFATYDANEVATHQSPAFQQVTGARIWSVSYGNAILDHAGVATAIAEKARQEGVERIAIHGYSTGSNIGTVTARHLIEETPLHVEAIYMVSAPAGYKGLQPDTRHGINMARNVLEYIPNAKYSSAVRFVLELIYRQDQYAQGSLLEQASDAIKTGDTIQEELDQKKFPGTWLLADQALAIQDIQLADEFQRIAAAVPHQTKPLIVYLGTDRPGHDYMVNDNYSAEKICQDAMAAGLTCLRRDVPGAVHTRPDIAVEAYQTTISTALPFINFALQQERERVASVYVGSGRAMEMR